MSLLRGQRFAGQIHVGLLLTGKRSSFYSKELSNYKNNWCNEV